MAEDDGVPPGPADQDLIGEFLQRGHLEPDQIRRRLALLAGSTLLDGSALAECIASDELPEGTLDVLQAALELRQLSDPLDGSTVVSVSQAYSRTRDGLSAAADLVDAEWPGAGILSDERDPDLDAFDTVGERLHRLEERARRAEEIVDGAGYRFDPESRRLETQPGAKEGRPRQLLRDLVEALLARWGRKRNDRELRARLAGELAPFFSVDVLDVSSRGVLKDTVDNVYRSE